MTIANHKLDRTCRPRLSFAGFVQGLTCCIILTVLSPVNATLHALRATLLCSTSTLSLSRASFTKSTHIPHLYQGLRTGRQWTPLLRLLPLPRSVPLSPTPTPPPPRLTINANTITHLIACLQSQYVPFSLEMTQN